MDFENAKLSEIEKLETENKLSKNELLVLAKEIGISKTTYTSRSKIYQDIKRFILNRDIITNIESTIKGE